MGCCWLIDLFGGDGLFHFGAGEGFFAFALLEDKDERFIFFVHVHFHRVPSHKLAFQDLDGERTFDEFLQGPFERASAEGRVVALRGQPGFSFVAERDGEALVGNTLVDFSPSSASAAPLPPVCWKVPE